jgi:hypothetical protein
MEDSYKEDQLPGLPDGAYTEIKLQTTLPMKRLSPSEELLCPELDKEMERQGEFSARGVTRS